MTDRFLTVAILITAVASVGLNAWFRERPDPTEVRQFTNSLQQPKHWESRPAPDFEVPLLDGSTFRLADHIGRQVIVINFFATWCGPCRQEMPELLRYYEQQAARAPFVFVAIDAEEKRATVEQFARDLTLTFPIGLDESGDIQKKYGVSSFPTTVIIGADGRVALYETGMISNADVALGPKLSAELTKVRDGRVTSVEQWRTALATEPAPTSAKSDDENEGGPRLEGRAKAIAEAMPCPCGCEQKVMGCTCQTAKGIKGRLAKGGFDKQTDAEVMQALNREFCMKGM
jgi:thiol-disulfide isomerase/thioredoxin